MSPCHKPSLCSPAHKTAVLPAQGSGDAWEPHRARSSVTFESQARSPAAITSKLNLRPGGLETRRCPAPTALEGRQSAPRPVSQSIFQSLTSICGLRLVFVSPYFVFFLVMNGYCQAGLGEAIGSRWGLRWRAQGGGFHGGVYCLRFFSRDEMELEDVPEVTHGSHEIDTRVTLCLVPLHPSQEQARPLPLSFPHKYTVWSGGWALCHG